MNTDVSTEFIALCRAQLQLLAEGFGASSSIVYLTEALENGGTSKLLPVIIYPEPENDRSNFTAQILPSGGELARPIPAPPPTDTPASIATLATSQPSPQRQELAVDVSCSRSQIVLPLVNDGAIVGLLMTTRDACPWTPAERSQIQQVAQTIALAGRIDLRRNWLATELQHQQQLQQRQQALMHNLLHQLRNPLTAIRTFGKLLIKRLQSEDPNRSTANSIVRESDRLQELLRHLEIAIDLERIDPAHTERDLHQLAANDDSIVTESANLLLPDANFRNGSCQLSTVIDPLIESAEAIAQERNLTFHAHVPSDLPLIKAHPAALREVLSNLIDNALKYTPAGGEVDVDVEIATSIATPDAPAESSLQICIRDTGVGIPAQDLAKLFTRHYRGVQAQGAIAGTGLGLAIAKELVTHMHGKIAAVSPPPGSNRGTEFMLYLPLVDKFSP